LIIQAARLKSNSFEGCRTVGQRPIFFAGRRVDAVMPRRNFKPDNPAYPAAFPHACAGDRLGCRCFIGRSPPISVQLNTFAFVACWLPQRFRRMKESMTLCF
jgi:hypothetical protein